MRLNRYYIIPCCASSVTTSDIMAVTYQFNKEEGLMGLCASLVQCPTGCPIAVTSWILMSKSLVNVQDSARRRRRDDGSWRRRRPVDRHVTYDGHSQVGMRLQAERQDRDTDEKHRHQADDLFIIIEKLFPFLYLGNELNLWLACWFDNLLNKYKKWASRNLKQFTLYRYSL